MRCDHDEQFVVLFGDAVVDHGLIEAGDESQPRNPAHGTLIADGNVARHDSWFAIAEADAAFVFFVGNHGHTVGALPGEGAHLQFERHAHFAVAVNDRLRLQVQSQILVTDRRKRRDKGLIPEYCGNLRRVEDGRVGSIQDGIAGSQMEGRFVTSAARMVT